MTAFNILGIIGLIGLILMSLDIYWLSFAIAHNRPYKMSAHFVALITLAAVVLVTLIWAIVLLIVELKTLA